MTDANPRIACEQCGNTYRWREDLAGRRVKCKCGQVMTMPDQPPGESTEYLEVCPGCSAPLSLEAVVCTSCGFDTRTGSTMNTQVVTNAMSDRDASRAEAREKQAARLAHEHRMQEWIIPCILLGVGFLVSLVLAATDGDVTSVPTALWLTAVGLLIGVAATLPALFITAKLMSISFGRLDTAILKLAAIYIFPGAMGGLADLVLEPIGILVSIGLYYGLISWLFSLDFFETFICVIVINIVTWIVYFTIVATLFGMFMPAGM